jgi:hypothetical protein
MQPVLIIAAVEPEMRARALGIMAMTIGTGPFGLLLTGLLSSWIGPALTIGGMALLASFLLISLIFWYRRLLFDAP